MIIITEAQVLKLSEGMNGFVYFNTIYDVNQASFRVVFGVFLISVFAKQTQFTKYCA